MFVHFLCLVGLLASPSFLTAAKIRARVVDQNKRPVDKAESRLMKKDSEDKQDLFSNKKGELEFGNVGPGVYQLLVQRKDHLSVKSDFVEIADHDITITVTLPELEAFQRVETDGNAALEKGDYHQALEKYQELLSWAPRSGMTWSNVARCYAGLKDREKAKEAAQKAVVDDPAQFATLEKQVLAWISFVEGRELLEQKQFEKAQAALSQAVDGDPTNPEVFYGLALAYGHQRKYPEALKNIDEALKLKPGDSGYLEVQKILKHNAEVASKK